MHCELDVESLPGGPFGESFLFFWLFPVLTTRPHVPTGDPPEKPRHKQLREKQAVEILDHLMTERAANVNKASPTSHLRGSFVVQPVPGDCTFLAIIVSWPPSPGGGTRTGTATALLVVVRVVLRPSGRVQMLRVVRVVCWSWPQILHFLHIPA